MKRNFAMLVLIFCFRSVFGSAQETKGAKVPTGLALEVTFIKDRPPAYIPIGQTLQTTNWAWYEAFGRLPNFQTSAEKLPVLAVKFIPYLEDNIVKVKVRVFTGQKTFEKEEQISLYSISEGEKVSVGELTAYGVVPFEIAVIRVTPNVSVLPSVENKTTSLQVVGIEPNYSTFPTYKLTVRNTANKPVSAFSYETMIGGRVRLTGMPQNQHGEHLIQPGETYTKEMPSPLIYEKRVEGETPKQSPKPLVVISSVVYSDGSFEGDSFRAARFRSYVTGRKMQVRQIINLLESSEKNVSTFKSETFAGQSSKLETKVDEQEIAALLKQFPSLSETEKNDLRESAEAASSDVKIEFINGTKRYQPEMESGSASEYFKRLGEQYRKWLSLLQ